MEKVANIYEARFVVNISELGEDDPLTQNLATIPQISFAGKQALLITESSLVYRTVTIGT
ncbi:unnamed protein product [Dovyalis caffra]|uniref:Uncharacterized protein n=1 Tax=Dovyalis caffra TaxID=77055 RepID=A0AAV1RPB8_9ROSI|nr:unnamed protein product [Dovyalis caffra]